MRLFLDTLNRPVVFPVAKDRPVLLSALAWADLPAAIPMPVSPIGERGFFRVKVEE